MDLDDPFDLFAIPLERPINSIEEILDTETGLPVSWIRILQDQWVFHSYLRPTFPFIHPL